MTGKTGTKAGLARALAVCRGARPRLLVKTAIAEVHAVETPDGAAVLKWWHKGHPGNETAGLAMMRAWQPSGAMVRILRTGPDFVLMERLAGPSLGDLVREGRDAEACALLAETAGALHRRRPRTTPDMPTLDVWMQPLFDLRVDPACPAGLTRDIAHAVALARHLLDTAPAPLALHGDLHHDNVILTRKGPIAFDAKGLQGDPAFELANAMRNPKGVPDLVRDPARIDQTVSLFAQAQGIQEQRLMAWAAVKCAHSIALRAAGQLNDDAEADLLAQLRARTNGRNPA